MSEVDDYLAARERSMAAYVRRIADLRLRQQCVESMLVLMRQEHYRCRAANTSETRAFVPPDDLTQAGHYLANHLNQLKEEEARQMATPFAAS